MLRRESVGVCAQMLNAVCVDRDTGRALVARPEVRLVAVTGSVRAGQESAAAVTADLKRLHLELGGNAPVLIHADADLDDAVE
ncbi:aldehyde dehydrogenase family protein [Streptomyces sp. NPDC003635]